MRARWFRDRPRPDSVKALLHGGDWHLFLFHYGATLRVRRPRGRWRHFTAFYKSRRPGTGAGGFAQAGTWLTRDGTLERVPRSKRYVSVKWLRGDG